MDTEITDDAKLFIKNNKADLISKFADLSVFPRSKEPTTIFMAGSPGAGKTEFSRNFENETLKLLDVKTRSVIIDADEIKTIIPLYNGKNSDLVKSGAIKGVDILYDYTLKNQQNIIMDGTFSNPTKSFENIKRSFEKGRKIAIFYIYQDPIIAWEFTKKRGVLEGRLIPKDYFVESFFGAKDNVNKIKKEYKENVTVHLVEKNYKNGVEKTRFNIENIDSYVKISYDKRSLIDKLKD
jgi:predicted ABC-type ATPase